MLEVLTPPASALVDLEAVKLHLGIEDDDSDDILSALIARASASIVSYIGAPVLSGGYRETFETGCGQTYLILSRTPVSSITSVTVDSTVLSENESRLDSASGLLARVSGGRSRPWEGRSTVLVEYQAGYETPPGDIVQAALTLIAAEWAQRGKDPSLKSISIGSIGLNYVAPSAVPGIASVAPLLDPYRAIGIG